MIEDESQHFVGKVAQKLILECDGKILVCRGVGDTLWEFPGGRLNNDGSPKENLLREIKEELGMIIPDAHPFHVSFSIHMQSNTNRLLVTYHTLVQDDEFVLDTDELEEARWIMPEELMVLPIFDETREAGERFLQLRNSLI